MVYLEDPHWTPQLQVLQEPESIKIKESQATEIPRKDPLIAYSWDKVAYLGAFLVLVSIIILIGHINSRLEHALVFAFILQYLCQFTRVNSCINALFSNVWQKQ